MKTFLKDRSEYAYKNKCGHSYKYYGYDSSESITKAEIEIMDRARDFFPYIPKIISYENYILTVEFIEGEHIDDYIKRTDNREIINKFTEAISKLQSVEIQLNNQSVERYDKGFICYHDYHFENFIVDRNENIWFIDWDISGLYPKHRMQDDKVAVRNFIIDLNDLK